MAISIIKKTGTANTTKASGRKIKYIVIHYTAGTRSTSGVAANTAAYFSRPTTKASADYIVDDKQIIQYNPDPANRYCWAVGGSKYSGKGGSLYGKATNSNCISIEICSTNRSGRITNPYDKNWYFTDAAVKNARELTKYLMEKYGIGASNVIRHYDVNGKPCPGIKGWTADSGSEAEWKAFKASLTGATTTKKESTSTGAKKTSTEKKASYKVKVSIADLNIRKGPGTDYSKTGKCTGKGTFTIVAESSGKGSTKGWGKLKSGAGWISLDYARKEG